METPATTTDPYKETSKRIIKDSIQSAVFIDENAWVPYNEPTNPIKEEEELSKDLFQKFKDKNISLAVHKFQEGDLKNDDIKGYLFEARDLILLDWKLAGESGEKFALQLMAEIISKPHIHFCCIYTNEDDLDGVLHNILAFFSGETETSYNDLGLSLAAYEEEIKKYEADLDSLSVRRNNKAERGKILSKLMKDNEMRAVKELVLEELKIDDVTCAFIKSRIALNKNVIKSDTEYPCPEDIDYDQKLVVIDNTVIAIRNKNKATDADGLIDSIADQIATSPNSYTKLLGVEMQNIFKRKGAFVDSTLLSVSKDAVLKHREQLKSDLAEDDEDAGKLPFEEFVKDVMIEQARMKLISSDLELLKESVLNDLYDPEARVDDSDLVAMNVFYNSTKLPDDNKVNFGDVFRRSNGEGKEEYFICITPKSDCLRPKKIRNSFFFAKGETIRIHIALELGDTAFISFLDRKNAVRWTEPVGDKLQGYKPKYIKPLIYTVPIPKFTDEGKIEMLSLDENGKTESFEAEYITTIRRIYAQRIANHAFGYPVRVSVDFVKLVSEKQDQKNEKALDVQATVEGNQSKKAAPTERSTPGKEKKSD